MSTINKSSSPDTSAISLSPTLSAISSPSLSPTLTFTTSQSVSSSTRTSFSDHCFDINNPYQSLILQCPSLSDMQNAYETHRRTRNDEKFKLLSETKQVSPDLILAGLVLHNYPPESDPRNCITIWARPTSPVMDLVGEIQMRLQKSIQPFFKSSPTQSQQQGYAESLLNEQPLTINNPLNKGPLWLMPRDCLHLSALEITHSAPAATVNAQIKALKPYISQLLNPIHNSPVLVKPLLCFDNAALALTFVPLGQADEDDFSLTYTHYRANLFDTVTNLAGVSVESRYQVPSAHITIARFIDNLPSKDAVDALLNEILEINKYLDSPIEPYSDPEKFSWKIGSERASECRCGRIWYGGGWSEGQGLSLEQILG